MTMRRVLIGLLFGCWAAVLAGQAPRDTRQPARAPAGTGSIAGVVTTADTSNRPLRHASVVLIGATTGTLLVSSTDEAGAFVFANLPADRYTIGASKAPYLGAVAGARRAARPGTPIVLAQGQNVTDVAVRLYLGASISGTVTTDDGQPAVNASIGLQQRKLEGTTRIFVPEGAPVLTDDRGRYRFFGLAPGEYIVASRGMGRSGARPLSDAEVDAALKGNAVAGVAPPPAVALPSSLQPYASVFYPGTTRPNDATPLRLAAGEDREGVDFRLISARVAQINGVITIDDGRPLEPARVLLSAAADGTQAFGAISIRTGPDGKFGIGGVSPGTYTATAFGSGQQAGFFATTTIEVDGVDQTLVLTLRAPLTLSARLVFEGASPPSLAGRRVGFDPMAALTPDARPQVSLTDATGAFSIVQVTPGQYLVGGPLFFGASSDSVTWSLSSVVVDGNDVTDRPLTITADAPPKSLVVSYGDRWQGLSGRLVLASGAPATDYTMIVFPADKTYWIPNSRRIRTARPATTGEFTLSGPGPLTVPPGDYLLAAVTDLDRYEEFDPALLGSLVAGAVPLTLQPGQQKVQDLVIK
jgi:carboxypeptidase family protein